LQLIELDFKHTTLVKLALCYVMKSSFSCAGLRDLTRPHRAPRQGLQVRRAKLNPSHISQIENGARNASFRTLVALGKALDVPWN